MAQRDVVVIGASAGGISALKNLVKGLPGDFPGSLFVVLHISAHSIGILPDILAHAGPLPASNARNKEEIVPGRIYVAPPNRHLLLTTPGLIHLGYGPKENRFRPAVDPLFRSAALTYGPRVVGIVLSGGLDDGTAGLWAIKQGGGLAIVQDPAEAEVRSMPSSALRHVGVDYCLSADRIAALLPKLVRETPAKGAVPMPNEIEIEVQVAADDHTHPDILSLGEPSLFSCPECNGSLLRVRDATPVRFRCYTGHAFTASSLEDELRNTVESSAWNAVRAMQEHAMLLLDMVQQPGTSEHEAAELRAKAEDTLERARLVRKALARASQD